MDDFFFLLSDKVLYIFILIIVINLSFSYLYFKFPYVLKLDNTNLFVIHQSGITICDKTFSQIIATVETFSDSEKTTTDAALSKVTSLFVEEHIICLINDKIYIFDKEGYLLKKNSEVITYLNVEFYSLESLGTKEYYQYFSVCFISEQKTLILILFKIMD